MSGLSRRQVLGLGIAGIAAAGCSKVAYRIQGDDLPKDISLPDHDVHPTARLINRLGFGPRPGQVQYVEKIGREAYVKEQLGPTDEEPVALTLQLRRLSPLRINGMELRDEPQEMILGQLQQAALLRAAYSNWQLRERMVDFWTNHFNIYARKGLGIYRKPQDDIQVVREHALGYFPAMLHASSRSPAMLTYLDNQVNKAGIPNENYARELMELHSLGIGGGYTQQDVQEVARCFTGWTVENRYLHAYGQLRFDPGTHDKGVKKVLGQVIPPMGEDEVPYVVDLLARHPSTARFISKKICGHFLGVHKGPWVDKLAAIYTNTKGSIGAMLEPLLLSDELRDGPPVVKRPLDFVVSSLRAYGAESDCGKPILEQLAKMGQGPFEWPMPDGYPDRTSAWTGSLLARWNFAHALCSNQISGTSVDFEKLGEKMGGFDPRQLALDTSKLVKSSGDPSKRAALALCAPEFQWR